MNGNVIQNGAVIAFSGLLIVFTGLILIEIVLFVFNKLVGASAKRRALKDYFEKEADEIVPATPVADIPEDDLIAIATAIECYRKIHFDALQSEITFVHGGQHNVWKVGYKVGQRLSGLRK
ncbi:MAG: OadG family protein [Candidatus Marinimicrobia bacterium]|nr:OadG family protein [Candidatus Neomarinimicrobiota bacterium]